MFCIPGTVDYGKFKDTDFSDVRQPAMSVWPPKLEVLNTHITQSMIDIGTVLMANLGLWPRRHRRKCLFPGHFINNRQPKIADKTSNTCMYHWNYYNKQHWNSNGKSGISPSADRNFCVMVAEVSLNDHTCDGAVPVSTEIVR